MISAGLGPHAHIEGDENKASDACAHAEGYGTKATNLAAHAEGAKTTSSGIASHAEGTETHASGGSSHAEGFRTAASGGNSHAEGDDGTTASGSAAHAEGRKTQASGIASHAEGIESVASGDGSHAEGHQSSATGFCAHAEGVGTIASGHSSHAQGNRTIAAGLGSSAHGLAAKATRKGQLAQGGDIFVEAGDAQSSVMTLMAYTDGSTPRPMTADGRNLVYAGEGTSVFTMAAGATAMFELLVAAHSRGSEVAAGWKIKGMIARAAPSGNARLVGVCSLERWADSSAETWSVSIEADVVNQCLKVMVTGEDGREIGWICRLTTAELAL